MKKILNILMLLVIVIAIIGCTSITNAATVQPEYDATFNNNKGIFYANGNTIQIQENSAGETEVTWNGGTQVVPNTVTIIGGGKESTSFEESNITMTGGTVALIYGGGCSLVEANSADVNESNVTINGGTVTATVYGGGLIYSKVEESNVTINNGNVSAVVGGGCASTVISGVPYAAGTEAEPQNSKSRVEEANVTVNGGNIDSIPSNYGTIFGGGQGYSYVGETTVIINGGEMSKAYVTAGGSNGYTGDAEVKINGGKIKIYQSVNRGTIKNAELEIKNGEIENVYVGGETDPSVTGKIEKSEVDIIGGTVENLKKGTSNGVELNIDRNNYKAIYTEGTVIQSQIGEQEIKVKYNIKIEQEDMKMYKGDIKELTTKLTTTPAGYEYLYEDEEKVWTSDDEQILTVDNNGKIQGMNEGETVVRIQLLDKADDITIQVLPNPTILVAVIIAIMLVLIVIEIILCSCRKR